MPMQEIDELKNQLIRALNPLRIYLFGSFASGEYAADSDVDFYIVVRDDEADMLALTTQAYQSIRAIKKRPVDIIVGSQSRFEMRKDIPSVENEVYNKRVLLYGSRGEALA